MAAHAGNKRKSGSGFVFSTLSFIIICAALVFGMSVFFRVSNIEVDGAKRYSKAEIVAASGVKDGDNLMLVDRAAVAEHIYQKLLYVGSVTVGRRLPNTVVIAVDESNTFATVDTDSGKWIVDKNGRLIEKQTAKSTGTAYIEVSGLKGVKPQKGSALSVSEEDAPKLRYLEDLLNALAGANLTKDVSAITVANSANPELTYLNGRFHVRVGKDEELDSKLRLLQEVVLKLEDTDQGTIDLSQNKKAQFSPN